MKCPACPGQLTPITAGSIEVDVCKGGCGGVWFDDREIKKFDEEHEVAADRIFECEKSAQAAPVEGALRNCPKCEEEVLCSRFYDLGNRVQVDQCLKCSGIWLDVGELAAIRGQYKTEADRNAAGNAYLAPHLKAAESGIKQAYLEDLRQWHEDVSFRGTLRRLFGNLLG